eukprot:6535532-Pyramimonas_sp.AAC.1
MPQHIQRVAQDPHQRPMLYSAFPQAHAQKVGGAPYATSSSPNSQSSRSVQQVGWLQPNGSHAQEAIRQAQEALKGKLEDLATTVAAKTLFKYEHEIAREQNSQKYVQ